MHTAAGALDNRLALKVDVAHLIGAVSVVETWDLVAMDLAHDEPVGVIAAEREGFLDASNGEDGFRAVRHDEGGGRECAKDIYDDRCACRPARAIEEAEPPYLHWLDAPVYLYCARLHDEAYPRLVL